MGNPKMKKEETLKLVNPRMKNKETLKFVKPKGKKSFKKQHNCSLKIVGFGVSYEMRGQGVQNVRRSFLRDNPVSEKSLCGENWD